MAMMKLRVTPKDGDAITVPVTPAVIVTCERHFGKGMTQLFGADSATFEALAFAAYHATKAAGHEVKTFDLWLADVDEISAPTEEAGLPLSDP